MLQEEQQVYWYSGIYLQPQHFQSIDLHHSFMLARQRQLSQPCNQGYYECVINDEILSEFTIKIEKIKAVLPSGYYLEYPGNCILSDKCLSYMRNSDEQSVNLWLALRRFSSGHTNVSCLKDNRGLTRWVSSDDETIMRDVYHESPDTDVTRIKYDVRILTEEEKNNTTDCEFLPLIRIVRENNNIVIDQDYTFPALKLSASALLKKRYTEIYSELYTYKKKLAEYSYALVSANENNTSLLLISCAINRALPLLEFFLNEDLVHPWLYHMTLRQLAGEISSFNRKEFSMVNEWDLTYKHYDQVSCLNRVRNYLKFMLDVLCCDKNINVTFNSINTNTLICNVDEWYGKDKTNYYIKLTSNFFRNRNFIPNVLSEIKISSVDYIELIIQHALPGVSLTEVDTSIAGLPEGENILWLKVEKSSEMWRKIEEQKKIAFYWSRIPDDLSVELVMSHAR